MKDDLIHERYERYADHNQDHKFFDNMQDELQLTEEDVNLLKEIQENLENDE